MDEEFPLEDITSTLVALEFSQYLKASGFNSLPLPMHIVRLVDAIKACELINGFQNRKNDLKARLSDVIRDSRKLDLPTKTNGVMDLGPVSKYHDDLFRALLSTIDEFRIAYCLHKLDSSLEFTTIKNNKYPDFRIQNYKTTITETSSLIEVKSRLNRSYLGEEIQSLSSNNRITRINERDIITLLCKDAFTIFEEAFDEQKGQIAFVNLSHSNYGDIFAAYSIRFDEKYDLNTAFRKARELVDVGKRPVILYTEVLTLNPKETSGISAITLEKEKAKYLGERLDKIEKDYYRDNIVHLDYFQLIDKAHTITAND